MCGVTMSNKSFCRTRMLASQVLCKVQNIQTTINEKLTNFTSKDNKENLPPEKHVNSTIAETNIQHEMLKMLKDMHNELNILRENRSFQKILKAKTPLKLTITFRYY